MAIAFDNAVDSGTLGPATSNSFAFTVGAGAHRILLAGITVFSVIAKMKSQGVRFPSRS